MDSHTISLNVGWSVPAIPCVPQLMAAFVVIALRLYQHSHGVAVAVSSAAALAVNVFLLLRKLMSLALGRVVTAATNQYFSHRTCFASAASVKEPTGLLVHHIAVGLQYKLECVETAWPVSMLGGSTIYVKTTVQVLDMNVLVLACKILTRFVIFGSV